MLPPNKKRRPVILTDAEYKWMRIAAKMDRRSFSCWAGVALRKALLENPRARAMSREWDA